MGKIMINGNLFGSGTFEAKDITFDNGGVNSSNVQDAIEEVGININKLNSKLEDTKIILSSLCYNNPLIPQMTSKTTPSGECIASDTLDETKWSSWKAFNGTNNNNADCWISTESTSEHWICYKFTKKVNVVRILLANRNYSETTALKEFILQGSNDNLIWENIKSFVNSNTTQSMEQFFDVSENVNSYLYYRLYITSHYGHYAAVAKLQMYGY